MKLKIIFTSELKLINYSSSLLQMFLTEALFKKSFRVFHVDPNTASITSVSPTSFSAIFKVPAVALSPSFSCIIQAHTCTVIKLLALKFALYLKKKKVNAIYFTRYLESLPAKWSTSFSHKLLVHCFLSQNSSCHPQESSTLCQAFSSPHQAFQQQVLFGPLTECLLVFLLVL